MSTAVAPRADCTPLVQKLAKLRTQHSRREFLRANRTQLNLDLIIRIVDQARDLLRVDARQSLALAETAVDVARMLKDRLAMAHALRSKANAHYALDHHRAAVRLYERSIGLFEALGQEIELGRTLSVSILSLNLSGKYEAAFAAAERARKIFVATGDELRVARVDLNLGNVYYRQDRFSAALESYRRAYRVVLDRGDQEGIAVVLSNLAVCLTGMGEFGEALRIYEEAREACDRNGMARLVAQADYNIAYLYFLRGEYSGAIERLRSARTECKKVDDRYHHALCNLDLSEIYLELNLSAEAAELARDANAEFTTLRMRYERAKAVAFEAIALGQLEQPRHSLKAFRKARALFVAEKNQVWPSLIDLYQAVVLFNDGRVTEARALAKVALRFFASSLLPTKAALCKLLLARMAHVDGDVQQAKTECAAALDKLQALQAPMLQQQLLLLMGQIHATARDDRDAYSCLCASRRVLETLRGNVRGQELKLSFIRNRLEVYELLVDACLRNASEASLAEAFGYIEEAKSRILLDQMVRPTSMNQSTAVLREGNLRDELNSYYSLIELEQLRAGRRSARLQRLQAKARAHESELVRALHEIGAGESACTREDKSHDVTLQKTRDTMPRDAVILEYFQTGDRIVACVLSRESLRIVPVTLASRIGRVLRLLHFQLSKLRFGPEYTDTFRDALLHSTQRHLESLYRELLANIRDQLNASHLVIVPHGTLHYVPFHALFDGRRYVIDDHTVSYAPSATIYSVCLTNSVNTSGPTLLMGVPDEKAPLIKNEIQCLQAFMPSAMAYLGASATERVLKSEGPSSRIVHIATHGCFRHDNPMFSSIRLGDSYLSLYDLYHLRLPAELVTLSGCATGLNAIAAGDELIGLARGLFQAGARSLLLSLWEAHDVTTAQFMKTFYGRLCDGADRASAARDAMLEVRNDYPHPYQWAPFVLMGGHGPLER